VSPAGAATSTRRDRRRAAGAAARLAGIDAYLPDAADGWAWCVAALLDQLRGGLDAPDPWHAVPAAPDRVLLLGMGSSRYAAQVAALRLRADGIDAVAEYASAEASYPAGPARSWWP
jgi:hypothetical protein